MPTISVIGYLPNGREVRIEVDSHGDANRDISGIAGIDRVMSENGILPTRPVPGEGEQTQAIHYILRRQQKNKDNSYSPVFDLYGTKFRWVSCYINDRQQGTNFYQATGLDPNKLPLSMSLVKEIDTGNPDLMNLFAHLNPPIQIIWKANPRWRPDLTEDEKKKIPKRLFVRWASIAPEAPGVSNASNLSTQTQTDGRQIGQTNGSASTKTVSKQTDGRQTSQTTPPQRLQSSLDRQPRRMAMDNGTTKIEVVNSITVKVAKNQSHYYVTPEAAYTFTRELFREAGIACDHWTPDHTYAILPAVNVISHKDERGYWKIADVQPASMAETGLLDGRIDVSGYNEQPPNFDPKEAF